MSIPNRPPALLAWTVWGLGACLYLTGFYHRVAPAVMTGELMSEFSLSAAALGNLSAFYFYSYVAMQIPTGILADNWGPRKLLAAGSLLAALGAAVFGLAPGLVWANIGRLLIGGAVGVAWVSMIKLAANWLPPRRFALASGVGLLCGVLGAVSAGVPLRLLVVAFGWRPVMFIVGLSSLLLAVAVLILVRDDPTQRGYESFASPETDPPPEAGRKTGPLAGLAQVFTYRNIILLVAAPGGLAGPVLTFSGLWGVPFLKARYGLAQTEAAAICSLLMICWAVSAPFYGVLSDRLGRRRILYLGGSVAAFLGWAVMLYVPGLPLWLFVALTIVTGTGGGAIVLGFAFGKESVPGRLAGTSAGVINMGVMLGPTILQPAAGWLLDRMWSGGLADGVRIYDLTAFKTAFTVMLAWAALTCVMASLTKETHCRPLEERG